MSRAAFQAYVALPDIEPVDKIAMCQKYDFPRQDILGAYTQICTRRKPLSVDEGKKIGVETSTLIAQTREEIKIEFPKSVARYSGIIIHNLIDLRPSYHYNLD